MDFCLGVRWTRISSDALSNLGYDTQHFTCWRWSVKWAMSSPWDEVGTLITLNDSTNQTASHARLGPCACWRDGVWGVNVEEQEVGTHMKG